MRISKERYFLLRLAESHVFRSVCLERLFASVGQGIFGGRRRGLPHA
jgi:hypothetical protein